MKPPTLTRNVLAMMAALVSLTSPARAQSDTFADGDDNGWTHYNPLAEFAVASSYTVTAGTYHITCDPSPNPGALGPARAGAVMAGTKYKTFFVSVDIRDWNPAEDTSMGILARLQPSIGLGTTSGYAFTYQGSDADVQISRVDGESPTDLSGHPSIQLEPGGDYRMIFFGVGPALEGRIYDMANPATPLITVTGTDSTYTEGTCGLVVFSDENTRASAGFDNYLASAGEIAPPRVSVVGDGLVVSWDIVASLGHTLESSVDLINWTTQVPHFVEGGRFQYVQEPPVSSLPSAFYRLRLGPPPVIGIE